MTDHIEDPFVRRVYDRLKLAGGAWIKHSDLTGPYTRAADLTRATDAMHRDGLIRIATEAPATRYYAVVAKFYRPDPPLWAKELTP